MALLPVEEARSRILSGAGLITESEDVSLFEARDRVLARDLAAHRTQPPFRAAAMDGYAVRAKDVATAPALLQVIGVSAAGRAFAGCIAAGQAVRIFTGAPVPDGADALIIQEDVELLDDNRVRIKEAARPGRHIRAAGLDFQEGEVLLSSGMRLDAGRLTLAAAMNHMHLPVCRRPVVAIFATGDELVLPGERPGPAQIVASNGFGVAAIVDEAGGRVVDLGIVPDDRERIEAAANRAERVGANILVTLGGASVGDHDVVRDALADYGMELDFWKIAMRPGKPLMFGRVRRMRVLGLPGNPVSSMVCAHLFLRPLVARLAGHEPDDPLCEALLGRDVGDNGPRQDYMRARLSRNEDGRLVATPFERQDSSMMRVFAESDALIIRPPHAMAAGAGEPCTVHLLRDVAHMHAAMD